MPSLNLSLSEETYKKLRTKSIIKHGFATLFGKIILHHQLQYTFKKPKGDKKEGSPVKSVGILPKYMYKILDFYTRIQG